MRTILSPLSTSWIGGGAATCRRLSCTTRKARLFTSTSGASTSPNCVRRSTKWLRKVVVSDRSYTFYRTYIQKMITPEVIAAHNLTQQEFERIKELLGREPSFAELGIFSVMWSEHCSYKSSRIHLKRLPTTGPRVIVPPGENAGVVDLGDGWCAAFKIESHNHPSYIEPFQGAATGVGGILRDIFTRGARPLAVMDSLRFGPIAKGKTTKADEGTIHKNHSILEGVVSGIASYGNCFGVPNLGGETKFEDCYSN